MLMRRSVWTVLLACALWTPASAQPKAGEGASGETVMTIAKDLMCSCPGCAGKALDQCEPGCKDGQELRAEVAAFMQGGKTREQILPLMASAHGAQVLGAPPTAGWGILSVAIPLACLAGGALPLWWLTRGKKQTQRTMARGRAAQNGGVEDERVAAALKDFDY